MEETIKPVTEVKRISKIDEYLNDPALKAAKLKIVHTYKDLPGFSGIGIGLPAEGEPAHVVALFYDTIPDNFLTKIDGVPVVAKIVGPIKKQYNMPYWDDQIHDSRGA